MLHAIQRKHSYVIEDSRKSAPKDNVRTLEQLQMEYSLVEIGDSVAAKCLVYKKILKKLKKELLVVDITINLWFLKIVVKVKETTKKNKMTIKESGLEAGFDDTDRKDIKESITQRLEKFKEQEVSELGPARSRTIAVSLTLRGEVAVLLKEGGRRIVLAKYEIEGRIDVKRCGNIDHLQNKVIGEIN
ncbi:hypothetical protein GWI33_011950 [Rhynchophorus ferrugineus]|uniref:Uncharacterized protein n=1 Tax=Rhynchophorus ferrugineus TaxID=354439 RepID=A0A834IPT4_RHYFE|nr:hypothetical protein GWI33_011950 [Rhynchophorus ferrugineus]